MKPGKSNKHLLNVYVSEEVYSKLIDLATNSPMTMTQITEAVFRDLFELPYRISEISVDRRKLKDDIVSKKNETSEPISLREQAIKKFVRVALTHIPKDREGLIPHWQMMLENDYKLLITEEELKDALEEIKEVPQKRQTA